MKRRKSAREVALDVLIAVETRDAYSNLVLDHELDEADLSMRDRGLATELVYGTIQRQKTLDWLLDSLVKKGWIHSSRGCVSYCGWVFINWCIWIGFPPGQPYTKRWRSPKTGASRGQWLGQRCTAGVAAPTVRS